MIEIISIHIPKTAGTAFYHALKKQYGSALSPSYKRKHIKTLIEENSQSSTKSFEKYTILHGHVRLDEVGILYPSSTAKLITWVREPVDRLISNYYFFKHRLENPEINPEVFEKNKHRINESLLEYARLDDNRNRMAWFLNGINIEDFFFIGVMEYFDQELLTLSKMLDWKHFELPPKINLSPKTHDIVPIEIRNEIAALNQKDMLIYQQILNTPSKKYIYET
jgi:hypothetical protein